MLPVSRTRIRDRGKAGRAGWGKHSAGRVADKRLAPYLRTPEQWLGVLDPGSERGQRLIERTYGVGGSLVQERLRALRSVVRLFARAHGSGRKLFLVRAPGRINLMGRHIDHQGGFVHAMALDCEIVMAASPRPDDVIRMVNADPVDRPHQVLEITLTGRDAPHIQLQLHICGFSNFANDIMGPEETFLINFPATGSPVFAPAAGGPP